MDENLKRLLDRQQYKLVGEHSAVKLCHWLKQRMIHGRHCYKEEFYGIQSHRCLQMTPSVDQCNQNCIFCWRVQNFDSPSFKETDEPEDILDGAIEAQRLLVSGFKGDERCSEKLWEEARNPNQVAISLSGEPTFYPKLGEFIDVCRKRGMTTFLVTNGTTPKVLEKLDPLPTQLYVTVAAPNREVFERLCVPTSGKAWDRLNETLDLLPSLDTRTVIRHTLVDGWNLGYEEEYAKLDERARPMFVEPKGYVFVGYSRKRMNLSNMPSHEKVRDFSLKLGGMLGYDLLHEMKESRVVLLGKDRNDMRIREEDI